MDNTAVRFPTELEHLDEVINNRITNKTETDVRQFILVDSEYHATRPLLPRRCGRVGNIHRLRIAGGTEAPKGSSTYRCGINNQINFFFLSPRCLALASPLRILRRPRHQLSMRWSVDH